MITADMIHYEQPIHEHIRACLRLEHLFQETDFNIRSTSVWETRNTVSAIADILTILERPDLKTKLVKELIRIQAHFKRFVGMQEIDQSKLKALLKRLEELGSQLQSTFGKIGQDLRQNEFFSSLRQRLQSPAGTCDFDVPAYHLWLQQSPEERTNLLRQWLSGFSAIRGASELLLHLIRQSTNPCLMKAEHGFLQMSLDAQVPAQLIRVILPPDISVYPEISVGRHGLSIRFIELKAQGGKTLQTPKDINFWLALCIL